MDETEIKALYGALIEAWNTADAPAFAALFTEDGHVVGFDGSQLNGRAGIEKELTDIFSGHQTAPFVTIVREVRFLTDSIALLRAVVGMPKAGTQEINPEVNAVQTLIATKWGIEEWRIELFQNTPAQFHGRPEIGVELTKELSKLL